MTSYFINFGKLSLLCLFALSNADVAGAEGSLKIVNQSLAKQILEDASDNPPNYSIGGRLVPRDAAILQAKNGALLCMSRSTNGQVPDTGEVLLINSNNAGVDHEVKNLHWRTIGHAYWNGHAFAILCMRFGKPVSNQDVAAGVVGIVEFGR